MLVNAVSTFKIIESYPHDKYLPSFLVRWVFAESVFHAQIATDAEGNNIRIVTIYVPAPDEWNESLEVRRTK